MVDDAALSRKPTPRTRPDSGRADPRPLTTGRTVACTVALLLCAELLVWDWIGGPNDRVPVVAASLTIGLGAGVAAALLSLFLRRAIAVVVTLVPVIALVVASHLGPPGISGTAALLVAFLLAAVAASLVAVAAMTRPGRWILDAGAALVLSMLVGIEIGDRPPMKPIPSGDAPDIILLVMDTTRRDHLSVYGYPRETMPAVTRFARRAQIYDDAWSVAPWTTPSHASMLSALLPGEHDADGEDAAPLPSGVVTLAAVLGDAGYRTAGFAANPNLHAPGWDRDYDVYRPPWWRGRHTLIPWLNQLFHGSYQSWKVDRTTQAVFDGAKKWWRSNEGGRRFLFLNVIDPHAPYQAPEADQREFLGSRDCEEGRRIAKDSRYQYAETAIGPAEESCIKGLYDAELHAMDREIGEFFDWLGEHDDLDEILVIVTSDHGERLGERGHIGHLLEMDQHLLRIPLLVRYPRVLEPQRIGRRVLLTGLPGYVLDLVGIEGPKTMRERSFDRARPEFAVAQHRHFGWFIDRILRLDPKFSPEPYRGDWTFVADDRYALLWAPSQGPDSAILIDYSTDRHLAYDRSAELPDEADRLRAIARTLPRFPREREAGVDRPIDADLHERLKALGYTD